MEYLLNPDTGMMAWTVVVFLLLVFVVSRYAWGPIVRTLNEREEGIRKAIEESTAARQEAERLRAQLQKELSESQSRMQALINETQADAQRIREQILKDAHDQAKRLEEQARHQLEEERTRLLRDLRQEISGLSVTVAERLLRKTMNAKEQEAIIAQILKDLDKEKTRQN